MRFKEIIKFSAINLKNGKNTGNLMKNIYQTKKSLRKLVKNNIRRVKKGQRFWGVQMTVNRFIIKFLLINLEFKLLFFNKRHRELSWRKGGGTQNKRNNYYHR